MKYEGFLRQIKALEKRVIDYYNNDSLSDIEDSKENYDIKFSLCYLIIDVYNNLKQESLTQVEFDILLKKGIEFFVENTGSVEDEEILKEVFKKFIKLGIVKITLIDDLLNNDINQRWK